MSSDNRLYKRWAVPLTVALLVLGLVSAMVYGNRATAAPVAGGTEGAPSGLPTTTPDGRQILYGEDGIMPVFIEDPVTERGAPIQIGPQHVRRPPRMPELFPGGTSHRTEPFRIATPEEQARLRWGPEYEWSVANGLPLFPPDLEPFAGPLAAEAEAAVDIDEE